MFLLQRLEGELHLRRSLFVAAQRRDQPRLKLSDEDRQELLPSGKQPVYDNRLGWANPKGHHEAARIMNWGTRAEERNIARAMASIDAREAATEAARAKLDGVQAHQAEDGGSQAGKENRKKTIFEQCAEEIDSEE